VRESIVSLTDALDGALMARGEALFEVREEATLAEATLSDMRRLPL
jgi:hypothetical protein